uniref:Uncharacterized protein n=1 Tax=Heterorhabditis bacteriophora TaxID=37862 RepID=A0A1I7XAH7_HETBA
MDTIIIRYYYSLLMLLQSCCFGFVVKRCDGEPGSDSYAYENPWPKLNGGRLDWLFGDGWRRPLAKEQGAKMAHLEIVRREKAGLPLISPDLVARERVIASLPADEELRDFEILI